MSGAQATTLARGDFHTRLQRIDAGDTICGDEALVPLSVARAFAKKRNKRSLGIVGNLFYPLTIVFAFALGMVSVVLGRLARYHAAGADNPELDVDMLLAMDVGMAAMVAFALRMMFNLDSKVHMSAKTAGIMVMVATMHNAVHAYPEMTALVFSEDYVAQTIEFTEPKTVIFRGMTFVM